MKKKITLRMSIGQLSKIKPRVLLRGSGHRYTAVILGLRWDRFFARLQNLRIDLKTDLEASPTVNVGDGGRYLWRMCISPWRMGKTKTSGDLWRVMDPFGSATHTQNRKQNWRFNLGSLGLKITPSSSWGSRETYQCSRLWAYKTWKFWNEVRDWYF